MGSWLRSTLIQDKILVLSDRYFNKVNSSNKITIAVGFDFSARRYANAQPTE